MEILTPPQLDSARVLDRSDAVVVASLYSAITDDRVRLLAAETYAELATVVGDPVWPGRTSWGSTVLRIEETEVSKLVLVRADDSDKLVVTPPAPTGWDLGFRECGETHCSFTWDRTGDSQHVDVVDMNSLEKIASYERLVQARRGVVDPSRAVAYHADMGLRLVAEDQRTGAVLWASPIDPPATRRRFDMDELRILVTGRGHHVLAIYGGSPQADEFTNPELSVFDTSTGRPVLVDRARFAALTEAVVRFSTVPGTDNLLITSVRVRSGGESRILGLVEITEVSVPALIAVSTYSVPKDHWLQSHAPGQIIPLASGRVLFAATR